MLTEPIESQNTNAVVAEPVTKPVAEPPVIKSTLKKYPKDLSGPSIREALSGKLPEQKMSAVEQHKIYTNTIENEEFTFEDLRQKWEFYVSGLNDKPMLKSSLSTLPVMKENYQLELEIENSIQEDILNSIKPEFMAWLRKELKNSLIQLTFVKSQETKTSVYYTDDQKYEVLSQKNPALLLLRQKFNLDFGN